MKYHGTGDMAHEERPNVDDYVPPRQRYGPRPEPYSPLAHVDPSDTEDRRAA